MPAPVGAPCEVGALQPAELESPAESLSVAPVGRASESEVDSGMTGVSAMASTSSAGSSG